MNRADYVRRLTELESVTNSQAADEDYQFERWLQLIFQIDPVITELMRSVVRDLKHWLETPSRQDPLYAQLAELCRSEDPDASLIRLYRSRAERACLVLGDGSISTLMAAARCQLQIDGPEMNHQVLARFRGHVLASPETIDDIYPGQFDNPVTVQTIAERAAAIKARRAMVRAPEEMSSELPG